MVNFGKTKCEIVKKERIRDFILFVLDKTVIYNEAVDLCINCANSYPFNTWKVGDYLEIDLDRTKHKQKYFIFDDISIVRKVDSSAVVSSSSAVVLPSISQNQVNTIVGQINSAINTDERNRYTAEIEMNPRNGNIIYRLSGERK